MKFIIRNDDVAYDTSLEEIKRFCEICDRYGFKIMHAITPFGEVQRIRSAKMENDVIKSLSIAPFWDNEPVLQYLLSRKDLIAVHGFWHTHKPSKIEIIMAKIILERLGFNPTYFVPPFNEGEYPDEICNLITCKLSADKGERLEDFLDKGSPVSPIMYLHSWRFYKKWYTFGQLELCLKRLSNL